MEWKQILRNNAIIINNDNWHLINVELNARVVSFFLNVFSLICLFEILLLLTTNWHCKSKVNERVFFYKLHNQLMNKTCEYSTKFFVEDLFCFVFMTPIFTCTWGKKKLDHFCRHLDDIIQCSELVQNHFSWPRRINCRLF